jgi:hypothetical protein
VPRGTQDTPKNVTVVATGLSPSLVGLPRPFAFRSAPILESYNPAVHVRRFGLLRFRSPLLAESSLFLGLLRCFSSPGSLRSRDDPVSPGPGFPIRTSPVGAPAHGSPGLFAVYHVLHRHLTPRHPPYALFRLLRLPRVQHACYGEADPLAFVSFLMRVHHVFGC